MSGKTTIKHLWFDFSDTIASVNREEYNKVLYSAYAEVLKTEATPELAQDFEKQFKIHKSNSGVFVALGKSVGFLSEELSAVAPEKIYKLADKNMPAVIKKLREILPVSIFSNTKLDTLLPALGLDLNWFTHILGPKMIQKPKPAPDGFYKMIELSKCRPNEILYIGDDVEKDLIPAKREGILTGLLWKESAEADYCFNDFEAILKFFK